jgi:hypothetical protein
MSSHKKGYNPKSKNNLKPAVKGEVRNKTGRPKKLPKLDELLAEVLGDTEEGKTQAQMIGIHQMQLLDTIGIVQAATGNQARLIPIKKIR